ncbi:MAG: hypothetical protein B6226_02730 [Candidatus Cloacimonetes bacterium 4572_65]|nr:MAG: hypothetical protein B6226_02730 [Candidatus Cloacimonetes bacterium 4572_65]
MKNKILIVSTNKDHRFLLAALIKKSGFDVEAPSDISQCKGLVDSINYYKIVIDFNLMDSSNQKLCNYLEYTGKLNKSIVINAQADDNLAYRVFKQGGRLIDKPYNSKDLVRAIH